MRLRSLLSRASKHKSKGVDALDSSDAALGAAQCLVAEYGANVVISGETDYVVTMTVLLR